MPPMFSGSPSARPGPGRADRRGPGRRMDNGHRMDKDTLAAYQAGAEGFARDWHEQPPPADLHALVRRFFRPGGRTADIGCGSGREVAFLALNGFHAVGYDASDALLEQARTRYPKLRFEAATLPQLAGLAGN